MAGNGSTGKSSMPITGMSSTSSSALSVTCPSLGSDNDVELDTDYKHRCRQLEVSLVKFKEKATRIRELLSVKMQEMESQVIEANRRTALAEDRCRELEVRLSGHGHSAIMMPPSSASSSGQERSLDVCGDYTTIVHLRAQLQEQRDLRTMEARLVAEKSAKIRDWVARKIQQMESQNQQLSSDNASLREEAKQLRERLIQSASIIQPPREFLKDVQSNGWHDIGHPANSTETAMTNLNDCSDYHEVYNDDVTCLSVSASLLEPRRTVAKCAPKIHIERKQFNDTYDLMALSTASSATSNSREPSEPLLNYTSQVSSKSVDSDMQTPVELTPKEPPSPLTPYLPNPPPNTPGTDAAHPASASTLPRCKKDSQRFFATDNSNQNNNSAVLGYGTVMTIDRKYKTQVRPKRPAPPTRRVPSWENRIYSMISTGLQFPHDDLPVETVAAHQISGDKKGDAEIIIPVFATLKGKVMLIRSSPFSGNSSSDSSDEEGNIVRTTCSSFQQDRRSVADRRSDAVGKNERFSQQSRTSSAVKQRIPHEGSYSSLASETSSDYAFPPEDGCSIRTESSDIELITKSVSIECSQAPVKQDMGDEKSGYLLKLSSRCKVWKQWWFVLKNGKLSYCRSPDSTQQPCHFIDLSSNSRVLKIESSQQIFQIVTAKQTIYLAAASGVIAKQWAQVIRRCVNSLSRDWQTPQVNLRVKDAINGWLIKVTNGHRRRCWCSLVGKNLIYYRASNDQTVLGELCLQGCRVEEICHSSDSDSDSCSDITTNDNDETQSGSKYTIAIWRQNACPTYLLCSSIEQKNSWLYQLTVASSGGGGCKAGTEMEQVISRLIAVDGDSSSTHWHEPIMLLTKDGVLQRPLTSVHSDDLQRKALEMFKLIRSFTWTIVDASQCDPSITIAQTLFAEALQHRELQTELYCQLIKQTSKHPASSKTPGVQHFLLCGSHSWFQCDSSPTSPTSSAADVPESKLNPPGHVIVQGWQLLTLAISLFLPSHSVMWLLKLHLQRYADSRTEAGKYAVFCQCALERALRNGSRTCRPSRLEVLSILLRNPYYHSQPISIPVHFSNGSYQVVSFDGSTTVSEFISSLEKAVGVRDASSSGFSLCSDDPTDSSREIWLLPDAKLCDVISKWEKDYVQSCGKGYDVTKTIRLCYKNRMYFSKMIRSETEKERVLFVYQTNSEVVAGRFPVSRDLALELAALMAQLEYGDFKSTSESGSSNLLLKQAVDNFYPVCYRSPLADDNKRLEQRVAEAWMLLRGKGSVDCVRVYLAVCRRWAFFGAKLFAAKLKRLNTAEKIVWLAVYEHGIAILDFTTMMMTGAHSYSNIVTFGGYCNDLVIVAVNTDSSRRQKSEHLLFSLSKVKIMEATQLISSYMNNLAFRKSETLVSSCWKK